MSDAKQTPLVDLLSNIPADARLIYEHSPMHSQAIPVGRLAAEAATAIRELVAENERLRVDAERYRWLRDDADAGDHSIVLMRMRNGEIYSGVADYDAAIDSVRKT